MSRFIQISFVMLMFFSSMAIAESSKKAFSISDLQGESIAFLDPYIALFRIKATKGPELLETETEKAHGEVVSWTKQYFLDNGVNVKSLEYDKNDTGDAIHQAHLLIRKISRELSSKSYQKGKKAVVADQDSETQKYHWSIGEAAKKIGELTQSKYGLYVSYNRGYLSGGSIALLVAGVVIGAYAASSVNGGYYYYYGGDAQTNQVGFVALMDLTNGEIVWFDNNYKAYGDIRKSEDAKHTVASILQGIPDIVLPPRPKPKTPDDL